MHIVISGGTGFVGQEITKLVLQQGHSVSILTRHAKEVQNGVHYVQWLDDNSPPTFHEPIDAIINLAGVSINDGRWTLEQQQKIYESRMTATNEIIKLIKNAHQKPKVLINASAIGIYPASTSATYTEQSTERATDFLAKTVIDWEQKANEATKYNVRVACARFGVILEKHGGALPLMALPYKLFAGGKIGSGQQWLSWVHLSDVAKAILFAIENEDLCGAFNVVAPEAKTMNDFGKVLAKVLHRPHWIPTPSFALKLALGAKSSLVLEGQHVTPDKLLSLHFEFDYPNLEAALKNIYE